MRTVVVTGGGKGIGRAVCDRFRAGGDRVVSVGRTAGEVDEICDVADETQVTALFERLGPVDVLVNNAGIAGSASFVKTKLADWQRHLDINATGVFLCTRAAARVLKEQRRGSIVSVSSANALLGWRDRTAYSASRARSTHSPARRRPSSGPAACASTRSRPGRSRRRSGATG